VALGIASSTVVSGSVSTRPKASPIRTGSLSADGGGGGRRTPGGTVTWIGGLLRPVSNSGGAADGVASGELLRMYGFQRYPAMISRHVTVRRKTLNRRSRTLKNLHHGSDSTDSGISRRARRGARTSRSECGGLLATLSGEAAVLSGVVRKSRKWRIRGEERYDARQSHLVGRERRLGCSDGGLPLADRIQPEAQ
jgi:hypothetical protein